VLGGLGLQLIRAGQKWQQRDMHVEGAISAQVLAQLPDRFEEGQPFDVAHRAAHLDDDYIGICVPRGILDAPLDLVRDMRNDLDRSAQEVAVALLGEHCAVDLAGGDVVFLAQRHVGESLVVAQVEVRLCAVFSDEYLTMLVGRHRARIDVQVGIQLLHGHRNAPALEQPADRRGRNPFAQAADNATGDEYICGHIDSPIFELRSSGFRESRRSIDSQLTTETRGQPSPCLWQSSTVI